MLDKATEHPISFDIEHCKLMSVFVKRVIETKPHLIQALVKEAAFTRIRTRNDYLTQLQSLNALSLQAYQKAVRDLRHQEMCRIACRALGGLATLEETLRETSDFADICLTQTLSYLHNELAKQYGEPVDSQGRPQILHLVALGKLGGRELNFSSDVDLMFAYPEEAALSCANSDIMVSDFFSRLAKSFVKMISDITQDGFVFRMDLRLRPHGQSGALVMTFSALETYYQEQGRDWERYAMIKARLLSPHTLHANRLHTIFQSFVYRRYIDFSVLEALRALKQLIAREVKLKSLSDDVKRGPGGIREIEFIVQALQLTHGGRNKSLQSANLLESLKKAYEKGLLIKKDHAQLHQAYLFLRHLENAIQMYEDRQTHDLPSRDAAKQALCLAFKVKQYDDLLNLLNQHKANVGRCFKKVLSEEEATYQDDKKLLENQLLGLWQGHLGDVPSIDLLLSLGFQAPDEAFQRLMKFAHSKRCQRLSQLAKMRLNKFIPLLLMKCQHVEGIDLLFIRLLRLIEGIIQRSAYLALLIENPTSLEHLLRLFSLSPWISEQVSEQPFLLEALLDIDSLYRPQSEADLSARIHAEIHACHEMEEKLEVLRQYKLKQSLMIAAASLVDYLPSNKVSLYLSSLATIVLQHAFDIALSETKINLTRQELAAHFAIIAYGKLGSQDLGFQSDLDLVFLHDCEPQLEPNLMRFAQRILNILNMRMLGGVLYHVDTRLRPSGNAGLLVSDINAFETYQKESAWTWEHQALVKARWVTGSTQLKERFEALREHILMQSRDTKTLADEITQMRQKMRTKSKEDGFHPIKDAPGGLIDIEFLIQYAVLRYAIHHPRLIQTTQTECLIHTLGELGIISTEKANEIKSLYLEQLEALHTVELGELNPSSLDSLLKKSKERLFPLLRQFDLIA